MERLLDHRCGHGRCVVAGDHAAQRTQACRSRWSPCVRPGSSGRSSWTEGRLIGGPYPTIRGPMSHETATEPLRFETFEAYLKWEEQQPIRYELHDGQVVAMAGASEDHNTIADTVTFLLRMHYGLRSRCKVFRADMKLRVGELKNRY